MPQDSLRRQRVFSPDAGEGGLDFVFESGDEFAVGVDEDLFGFDFVHDFFEIT